MCIKTQTSRFTGSSWAQLERLAAALQEADAVLVGEALMRAPDRTAALKRLRGVL